MKVKVNKLVKEADIAVDTNLIDMGEGSSFITGTEALTKLKSLEVGMPVVVKWGTESSSPAKQSIFVGIAEGPYGNVFDFYDGEGATGISSASEGFIKNGKVSFDFDNNDATEVTRLTNEVKSQSGIVEESAEGSEKTFSQWFDETYPETHDVSSGEFYPFTNYIKAFPNAACLKDATAKDIRANASKFYDVYDVDSADREYAFIFASEELGIDYDELYYAWLHGEDSESLNEGEAFYKIPEDLQKIIDGLSTNVDDPMYDNGYEVPDELLDLANNPPKNMRVKDWMRIIAPFEYQLDRIPSDITFENLYNGIDDGFLTNIDSDPRNEVLDKLYDIYDLDKDKELANKIWTSLGFERWFESEEPKVSETAVESRLLDLVQTVNSEYSLDNVQLYITDKGNYNIRTKADESNPIGKDIVTVSYGALIKDEDDEIALRDLGYFDDYINNMISGSEELTESVIPASNLDFAHQELAIIQGEIEKIAGLKSEDTANDLYTDLLEVLDKAVEVLSDHIAEQPIGTVVGDEPVSAPVEPTPELPMDMPMGESETLTEDEDSLEAMWSAVCSGDADTIKSMYDSGVIQPNTRYERFGHNNSFIMGALRNGDFDTAELLKNYGETILKAELDEYKSIMAKRNYEDETTKSALDENKSAE